MRTRNQWRQCRRDTQRRSAARGVGGQRSQGVRVFRANDRVGAPPHPRGVRAHVTARPLYGRASHRPREGVGCVPTSKGTHAVHSDARGPRSSPAGVVRASRLPVSPPPSPSQHTAHSTAGTHRNWFGWQTGTTACASRVAQSPLQFEMKATTASIEGSRGNQKGSSHATNIRCCSARAAKLTGGAPTAVTETL